MLYATFKTQGTHRFYKDLMSTKFENVSKKVKH